MAEDMPLADVVDLMESKNVKRLPVIRGDKLVGIVTRANLLQAVASLPGTFPIRRPMTTTSAIASSSRWRSRSGARSASASSSATASFTSAAS